MPHVTLALDFLPAEQVAPVYEVGEEATYSSIAVDFSVPSPVCLLRVGRKEQIARKRIPVLKLWKGDRENDGSHQDCV